MKIKLKVKPQKIKSPIFVGDESYPLLKFNRPNQSITRLDRYTIIRYYDQYKNGEKKRIREELFYPSKYVIEEIQMYIDLYGNAVKIKNTIPKNKKNPDWLPKFLIIHYDQLLQFGNGWNFITNQIIDNADKLNTNSNIEIKKLVLKRKSSLSIKLKLKRKQ